jgi:hypothetical protein
MNRIAAVAVLVLATSAHAETIVSTGATASHGMGEPGAGAVGSLEIAGDHLRVEGLASNLQKYTGAGWFAWGAAEAGDDVFARVRYSHRDGGAWAKDTAWVGAGAWLFRRASWSWRLHGEIALDSPNRERKIELRWYTHYRALSLQIRTALTHHSQGWGAAPVVLVGARF